jgi:hypothetical protein
MKRYLSVFIFGIIMVWALSVQTGCYYDNEEDLYPFSNICDTTNTSLSGVVKPILRGNCYGCHSASAAGSAGAGINLEDFASLEGWANNGRLVQSVEHTGCCPMPKGGSKLPPCDIEKIKSWVASGAQNN